jgi:hypothetical protein
MTDKPLASTADRSPHATVGHRRFVAVRAPSRAARAEGARAKEFNGKEVAEVFQHNVHRSIHDDRIREIRSRSVQARRRDDARAFHAAQRPAPRSVRRSIGRSIVRFGEAIAADRARPVASS